MKKTIVILMLLGSSLAIVGCQGGVNNEDVGMVGGAVAGGYVGNAVTGGSTLGTIGGAVGGAYVGKEVAKNVQ